ncbi:MAG TPA: hypothetical protein VIV11_20505 [Kofleriaceae bacterium]
MKSLAAPVGLLVLLALSACRVEPERTDVSEVAQEVKSYCELLAEQMTYCAFPNANGFGCYCNRDMCLDLMQQCEPDPRWTFHCYAQCPQTVPNPQPPFNPSTDCEEMLEDHSLPHWHICHYPRCWDLEPGETCIVPLGGRSGES